MVPISKVRKDFRENCWSAARPTIQALPQSDVRARFPSPIGGPRPFAVIKNLTWPYKVQFVQQHLPPGGGDQRQVLHAPPYSGVVLDEGHILQQ